MAVARTGRNRPALPTSATPAKVNAWAWALGAIVLGVLVYVVAAPPADDLDELPEVGRARASDQPSKAKNGAGKGGPNAESEDESDDSKGGEGET